MSNMLRVDRFIVDDSVVDDSFVEARDFETDSKAFTNINPTLLMNISDHNNIKPDSGHWSCWWTVTRTWWTIQMTGISSCQHKFRIVRIISSKSDPGPDQEYVSVVTSVNMLSFWIWGSSSPKKYFSKNIFCNSGHVMVPCVSHINNKWLLDSSI